MCLRREGVLTSKRDYSCESELMLVVHLAELFGLVCA